MSDNEFKSKYIELIDIVVNNSKLENFEKIVKFREGLDENDLELIFSKFAKSLEKNKKLKKLFLTRNERLFSKKHSVKLIPSVNLKSVLSSMGDDSSHLSWNCMQLLYSLYRAGDDNHTSYVNSLIEKIEECDNERKQLVETGDEPKSKKPISKNKRIESMMRDIAKTIKKNISSLKDGGSFEGMLKEAKKMTEKYSKDLEGGDLSFDELFKSAGNIAKEMGGDSEINEGLDKDGLKQFAPDLFSSIQEMADKLETEDGGSDIGGKMSKIKEILPELEKLVKAKNGNSDEKIDIWGTIEKIKNMFSEKKEEKKLTKEEVEEMEQFYENLSTKDIEGLESITKEEEKKSGLNVGNVLKGIIGGKESGSGGLGGMISGLMKN